MKLSKSSITKLKNKLEKVGKEIEVSEDGSVFYYENTKHIERLKKRLERKLAKIAARKEERKNGRNG